MFPTAFISHGAPDRILGHGEAKQFLQGLAACLPTPRAILTVSAHWESEQLIMTDTGVHKTIHDFYGFAAPLYQLQYPAEQPAWLTELLAQHFVGLDMPVVREARGLDHGSWSVLSLVYPQAQFPVAALSLPRYDNLDEYLRLGENLAALREEGVLILGTGSATHNLRLLSRDTTPPIWAREFMAWLHKCVNTGHYEALVNLYTSAPHGRIAHPTAEHFAPLLVAAGAARQGRAQLLHDSYEMGSLNNASWLFH